MSSLLLFVQRPFPHPTQGVDEATRLTTSQLDSSPADAPPMDAMGERMPSQSLTKALGNGLQGRIWSIGAEGADGQRANTVADSGGVRGVVFGSVGSTKGAWEVESPERGSDAFDSTQGARRPSIRSIGCPGSGKKGRRGDYPWRIGV